jgi:hypothetical protein
MKILKKIAGKFSLYRRRTPAAMPEVYMGPGDEAIVRLPTEEEQIALGVDKQQSVIEITREDGTIQVYPKMFRVVSMYKREGNAGDTASV